jgi:hypothetical protein
MAPHGRGLGLLRAFLCETLAQTELLRVGLNIDSAFRLHAKELFLEPTELLFEFLASRLRVEDSLDQFIAARLFNLFLRHSFLLLHLPSTSKRNAI